VVPGVDLGVVLDVFGGFVFDVFRGTGFFSTGTIGPLRLVFGLLLGLELPEAVADVEPTLVCGAGCKRGMPEVFARRLLPWLFFLRNDAEREREGLPVLLPPFALAERFVVDGKGRLTFLTGGDFELLRDNDGGFFGNVARLRETVVGRLRNVVARRAGAVDLRAMLVAGFFRLGLEATLRIVCPGAEDRRAFGIMPVTL